MTEYSATLCIVSFMYFSTLENITINNHMDYRITDCTIVLCYGSVVSFASNHFGNYLRRNCYYGTVLKLIPLDMVKRLTLSVTVIMRYLLKKWNCYS